MDKTLDHRALQASRYLGGLFGVETHIKEWENTATLPMYLLQLYSWYVMAFSGKEILLALPRGETPPPSMLEKHLAVARRKHVGSASVILPTLQPYLRQRLLERKVSFVVPNIQVFIPELGIAFKEQQSKKSYSEEILRPSAAHVIVLMLNHRLPTKTTLADIANAIGTTLMSASRAVDILNEVGLIETKKEGRKRYAIQKYNTHELWEHALPLLASPIKRTLSIHRNNVPSTALEAGYLALSKVSDLASPKIREYALSSAEAEPLIKDGLTRARSPQDADDDTYAAVQIWKYTPFNAWNLPIIDPYSLYLCLSGDHDERVAKALNVMLEALWLKG